jgi:hypothetical protein
MPDALRTWLRKRPQFLFWEEPQVGDNSVILFYRLTFGQDKLISIHPVWFVWFTRITA